MGRTYEYLMKMSSFDLKNLCIQFSCFLMICIGCVSLLFCPCTVG